MTFVLKKILDLLATRSPAGLISSNTFAFIKPLGMILPDEITYGLGFETRLADPSSEADFILRPLAPSGLEAIAALDARSGFPMRLAQNENWSSLEDLCRVWSAPGSPLHEATLCLWIEVDSEQLRQAVPSPSLVFVQLKEPCCSLELYESIAQAIHMSLKGCAMPLPITKHFLRCIEMMPEKGLMRLLGLPVARPTEAFRVVVGELEPDEIPEYVCSVGWKGRAKELESLIFSLGGYADRHSINFDLNRQGIGKIGIEFGIPQEHSQSSDPRWEMILDFLVKQGWCRKEKRDGLLAWPKPLTLMVDDSRSIPMRRFISHVKLSLEAGRRVVAKAYVGLVW